MNPVTANVLEPEVSAASLRAEGNQAVARGDLDQARRCYRGAIALLREKGDQAELDLVHCNLAAVEIELDCIESASTVGPPLRDILLRAPDPEICCLAAYQLARSHELRKDFKKAQFYARMARDRAVEGERVDYLAASYNLLGNVLLAESSEQEAIQAYEAAIALMPDEGPENQVRRARILDNLGYGRALQGHFSEAFHLLYQSLRTLRRHKALRWTISTHIDLCYTHLEVGRLETARRHGEAGLALASELSSQDELRNALYLLGEVAVRSHDEAKASLYFEDLQRRFFPDRPEVAQMLLAVGFTPLVNLRA